MKKFNQNVSHLIDDTVWKVKEGYIYITSENSFLWKKSDRSLPEGKYDIPLIEKHPLSELNIFQSLIKSEKPWADWWVWEYCFNKEMNSKLKTVAGGFCFTNEISEKINYNPVTCTTCDISIDKSIKNTIVFKCKKKYLRCF